MAALIILAASLPATAQGLLSPSAHVVGHGHPADCTQTALFAALDLGGVITFNCGAAPTDILFTTARTITATTSLNGGDLITLSGNNATRLFDVVSGFSLTLSHITLSNAKVVDDGGAIVNEPGASLVIDHATFSDNKTDDTHSGGAILNLGTLSISDSTFEHNRAGNGGALFPRFSTSNTAITNTVFTHNFALNTINGWGGAILAWDGAVVTLQTSQFISNTATRGGAILVFDRALVSAQASQFISNTATWGGALYVYPSSIPTLPATLTLTNSLLSYNLADSGSPTVDAGGGAIYSNSRLILADTDLEDNLTVVPPGFGFTGIRAGGAIWNSSAGTVEMTGGDLSRNRALHGGALYNLGNVTITAATLADNLAGRGGAIENANNAGNRLVISATTLSGNEASFALYPSVTTPLGAAIFNTAHLALTNSTLSGNSGSPALQEDNSIITLTNVTLAENPNDGLSSDQSPNTSQVRLYNTLLTDNGADNCGPIFFGTFTGANNLSSDNTCAGWGVVDNQNGVDPLISPLGYHGGPNLTHMLAANSPARNAGANCPTTDQRGILRPQGPACDIGAVERRLIDPFFALFLPLVRK